MEQQKTFNFNLPSPYQTEMAELARRQRMAETLQQQAAEPVQKFGYGGIEVPISPLSGLAKALNSFTARQIEKDVLKEQKDLSEKYRADQMGDVTRLVDMLSSRQATPEINTGGEYYSPAVASKAAGTIEPSAIGQLRTPEMQNFALQQYLSQLAPKAPIKISAGEALVNPSTFTEVYKAPDKADWSSPIREEMPDGSIVTVMYDKVSGNRRIIDTGGAKPAVSADTEARLKQEKEISDRAFNNLSENQRRQLQNEAARIGISAQELFFNTGLSAGVPAGARPSMAPAAAPAAPAPVTPAAPLPTPARAPSLVQPPVSAAPAQTAAPVPAPMAGMTPKTQQQVLADQFKSQYAALPEAANKQIVGARNLSQAVDEYQKALNKWNNYKMYDPNARAEMGRVYNNMMLQAKEAYNLGVLNGPDYDILTSIVADPTKPMSAFLTNKTLSDQAEGLKQTAQSIERISRQVHDRSSQSQVRVPRYNPTTKRIEP